MRIAMVSEHASPLAMLGGADAGGQNVYVAALATELGRLGHDVTVYTRRDGPGLPPQVPLAPGVVVEHVTAGPARPIPKDDIYPHVPAFARRLAAAWRTRRPDVVHSHFWMSGLAALAAARRTGVPVVHTFHALGVVKRRHQGEKDTSPGARLAEEERVVARADHLVATCSDEVFELLRLGADRHRITVVPCGVDTALFRPDGPVEPRAPGRLRVVALARLVERKGVGNTIEALAGVPDAELVVAGGPPPEELRADPQVRRLEAVACRAGVRERVFFRGRLAHEEAPPLLRSADAVACVPWYEPFGIVPLEAMACGAPVVATAVGGQVDTVVHRRTGLHVPPRDPQAIAAALRELLGDARLRASLGAAGAERARGRYSWRRVAAAMLDVYAGVAERAGWPAARGEEELVT